MRIRTLSRGDRAEWLRMLGGLYESTVESDHDGVVDAFLARDEHAELLPAEVFVCERDDARLAGFLELSVRNYAEGCEGATPYIESWYVEPDMRASGIGRLLMTAAEEWARAHGYRELASDTELENRASQQAHEALGFEEVERTVHFRKAL